MSVHSLSAPLGSILSGILMNHHGRRFVCIVAVLPLVLGWILIGSARTHLFLLAGRMFAGFAVGLAAPAAPVLLAECSEPSLRGFLLGLPIVAYSLGILITHMMSAVLTWRSVAWYCTIVPVVSAVCCALLVPESPIWLARKGRRERAQAALVWLRCDAAMAGRELIAISGRFERERNAEANAATAPPSSLWQMATQSALLKPLTIIAAITLLVLLAGTYLMVFYVMDIIRDMELAVNSMHAAIHTATVRLVASIVCSALVHTMRRRTLMMSAGFLTAASCLGLVAFRCWRADAVSRTALDTYVAAVLLLVYCGASMAFMMFPGILVSELLPTRVRGQLSGIVFGVMNAVFFGVAKVFPYFAQAVGMNGVFAVFGASSLLLVVFVFALLPETRGRTLGQIEDYFVAGKWLWMRRPAELRTAVGGGKAENDV